jgi:hypothetical protein
MASKHTQFGVAMRNFTRYPEMPSAQELIDYGVRVEKLGYESIWAWDHILLGVERASHLTSSPRSRRAPGDQARHRRPRHADAQL